MSTAHVLGGQSCFDTDGTHESVWWEGTETAQGLKVLEQLWGLEYWSLDLRIQGSSWVFCTCQHPQFSRWQRQEDC